MTYAYTIARIPFTFNPIGSIISHHDILQLIGSVMLRSARSEREILAEVAKQSFRQAIDQDVFRLRCHPLKKPELFQISVVDAVSS